jgi:hypothetical protein
MSGIWKAPLAIAVFALLSVGVTAAAAALALRRPLVSYLTLETRSRLTADYSADPLAQRLEPLRQEIIEAAAEDEAQLTGNQDQSSTAPLEILPTSTPAAVQSPESTTATPARTPDLTPATSGSTAPTGGQPTAVAGSDTGPAPQPSPTAPSPPASTATPIRVFTATQQPTQTPQPTSTAQPTSTPQPTATQAPAPTATQPPPTPTEDPGLLCDLLSPLDPLWLLLGCNN